MPNKKNTLIPQPDDAGNTFDDEDFILNYRPVIEYVEPDQVELDDETYAPPPEPETIDSLRDRTQKLINGYRAVAKLVDLAQKRVDERSKDFSVKLDPIKDQVTIAAMKRRFPDKADPTEITYADYKSCIERMHANAPAPPSINPDDVRNAANDPYRTDFGGVSNQQGQNRAEISSSASVVQPLDLGAFQKAGVLSLFMMMRPLIKFEDSLAINKHLASAGHLGGAPDVPIGVA